MIRGGSPPVMAEGEYWTFFHSSMPWVPGKRRYFMGAYAFEPHAPFRVTKITGGPLLVGNYRDPWKEGVPLVVFPGGAIYHDGKWFVTLGLNDLKCAWIEIPHDAL